jgi:hypothetical protein
MSRIERGNPTPGEGGGGVSAPEQQFPESTYPSKQMLLVKGTCFGALVVVLCIQSKGHS